MSERECNIYDLRWSPKEYLQQYYSNSYVPDDEEFFVQRLVSFLKRRGRSFARAIDFGCGPTVHLHTPLAPYVAELHLADYLPENLREVERWLRAEPDAHNWDLNIRRALEIEGLSEVSGEDLEKRKQLMRSRVAALRQCDVRQPHPLGDDSTYDLIVSAYCVDAATTSSDEWMQLMGNLLTLCADNGSVALLSSRKSQHYVLGCEKFPFADVGEKEIALALAAAGFDPALTEIEALPIKDWAEAGFDGIVIAFATKGRSS